MKTITEIDIYADDLGNPSKDTKLEIVSHWADTRLVVIRLPGKSPVTVSASELKSAIENAIRR